MTCGHPRIGAKCKVIFPSYDNGKPVEKEKVVTFLGFASTQFDVHAIVQDEDKCFIVKLGCPFYNECSESKLIFLEQ